MKTSAALLLMVGFLVLSAFAAAAAPTFPVSLCGGGVTIQLMISYVGLVGGNHIFELNGFLEAPTEDRLVSGTAIIADAELIHWAFTAQRAMGEATPEIWEFGTNFGLNGSGNYTTTDAMSGGPLTITPGHCPPID